MQDSHVQLKKLQEFLSSKELSNAEHMTLKQKLMYILSSKNFMEEIAKSLLTEADGTQEDKNGNPVEGPTLNREMLLLLPPKDRAEVQKKLDMYANILKETMDALNEENGKTKEEDAKKQALIIKQQHFLAYYQHVFDEMMSRYQEGGYESDKKLQERDSNPGSANSRNVSRITAVMDEDEDEDEDEEIEDMDMDETIHSAPNNTEIGDISEEVARATDDYIEQMMKFLKQSKKFDSYMDGTAFKTSTPERQSGLQVIEDDGSDDDDDEVNGKNEGKNEGQCEDGKEELDVDNVDVDIGIDDEDGQQGGLPSCKVTLEYDKNGELVSTGSGPGEVLKRKLNKEIIKALESFKMDYSMEDDIADAIVDSFRKNHGFLKNMNSAALQAMSDEPEEKPQTTKEESLKLDKEKSEQASVKSVKKRQTEVSQAAKAENNHEKSQRSDMSRKESVNAAKSENKDRSKNVAQKSGKSGKSKKKKRKKKKNKAKKENHTNDKQYEIADPNSTWICEFCEYEKVFGEKPYELMNWFDKKLEALDNSQSYRRRKLRKAKSRRASERNGSVSKNSSRGSSSPPPPPPPPPGSPPKDRLPVGGE